jgi:hypothetical protein
LVHAVGPPPSRRKLTGHQLPTGIRNSPCDHVCDTVLPRGCFACLSQTDGLSVYRRDQRWFGMQPMLWCTPPPLYCQGYRENHKYKSTRTTPRARTNELAQAKSSSLVGSSLSTSLSLLCLCLSLSQALSYRSISKKHTGQGYMTDLTTNRDVTGSLQ